MRVRAIHTDTPSIWVEGFCNVASGTTIIITADKISGSGTHNTWKFASAGEVGNTGATGATGATGPTGPTGVVTATAPITYNSGTQTVGIDLTNIAQLNTDNAFTGAQTITGTATGSVVATVLGASGQSANLQNWTNGGVVQAFVSAFGAAGFGTSTLLGRLTVNTGSTGSIGAVIRGVSGQTADLQQWQSNTGTILSLVNASGSLRVASIGAVAGGNAALTPGGDTNGFLLATVNAGNKGLSIRGAASQTANLQEWQNSAGTVLARVGSTGDVTAPALRTTLDYIVAGQINSGGTLRIERSTAAGTGTTNQVRLQVLTGTTGLRIVAVGPTGTVVTIADNIT
jgi:hypothetical protein